VGSGFFRTKGQNIFKKKTSQENQTIVERGLNIPTYSPQSNGMCEAFNGTFKRYYFDEHGLDNPAIIHNQIQNWIDAYNQFAPRSVLDIIIPNEFYNCILAA
jgi:putative transposase